MARKRPPGGESLSPIQRTGDNCPLEVTLLPWSSTVRRLGPFRPPGYIRQSEDRFCESVRRAYPRVCGATWGSGYLFFVPLEGVYYSDSRGDEVPYIAGDHCQVVA